MSKKSFNMRRILKMGRSKGFPFFYIAIILVFIILSIFGEALAPYPPNEINLKDRFVPPVWQQGGSASHVLGTDMLGRDLLSRLIVGARISFIVAILTITLGGFVGSAMGIISGYYGGKIDTIIMRAADSTMAFPIILLAMLLAIILGPNLQNVVISLAIVLWARFARIIRGEVLSFKERDFVALARVAGLRDWQIMLKHILPNIRNTLVVLLTLQVGWIIILEASLSFLGAGLPGPNPVWGSMIAKGREYITTAWWVPAFPGIAMSLVCLSFNMIGDWLREILDPRLRQVIVGG